LSVEKLCGTEVVGRSKEKIEERKRRNLLDEERGVTQIRLSKIKKNNFLSGIKEESSKEKAKWTLSRDNVGKEKQINKIKKNRGKA
jgi:hypothetical protein